MQRINNFLIQNERIDHIYFIIHFLILIIFKILANKSYGVTLKAKSWNFYQVSATVINLDEDYHFLVSSKSQSSKYVFNLYWNYNVQLSTDQKNEIPVPSFYMSSKKQNQNNVDDIISKQYISQIIRQRQNEQQISIGYPSYSLIFTISVYNSSEDVEVQIQIVDEETYKVLQSQYVGIFDLPAWVFYLMMGFAIIFFIAILCLVRALVKRYQEEQSMRINGHRRQLEQLTPEVVDSFIPKYPFKHIYKAVKKRKEQVLAQVVTVVGAETPTNEEEEKKKKLEQEEMCKKVQERCENILSNGECGICLCDFEFDEECRLTICDHIFHVSCFDPWLYKNQNCPYCRTTINQTTLKEWKNKTQQYYPLDQTLGSVQTLDNKKIDEAKENPEQDNKIEAHKEHKTTENEIFQADLIKFQQNPQSKNGAVQTKPIYFHSLSLTSLQQKDTASNISTNKYKNKQQLQFGENKNNLSSKDNKKLKTFSEINENHFEHQEKNKRKTNKANTYVHPKEQFVGAQSLHHKNPEKMYQDDYFSVKNNSPDALSQQEFKNGALRTIYQDGLESEASTRIRQDSHFQSILGDGQSQNRLFNNHDSSKLSSSGGINYNYNMQDSILNQSSKESPRDFQMIQKSIRTSKFSQQSIKSKEDFDNIQNKEILVEQQNLSNYKQNMIKEQKQEMQQIEGIQNLNAEGSLIMVESSSSESEIENFQNDLHKNNKNDKHISLQQKDTKEDQIKNTINKNKDNQQNNIDHEINQNLKQIIPQNNQDEDKIIFTKQPNYIGDDYNIEN